MYPKAEIFTSSSSDRDDGDGSSSSSDGDLDSIVSASYVKRSSGRHLLAQFTEVEIATLQQTDVAKRREQDQQETSAPDDDAREKTRATEMLANELTGALGDVTCVAAGIQDGDVSDWSLQSRPGKDGVTKGNASESEIRPEQDDDSESTQRQSADDVDDDSACRRCTQAEKKESSHVEVADSQIATAPLTPTASVAGAPSPVDRISFPFKTRQELHITYNVKHARYEGLPPAWRVLNHQFGLPLEAVPKRSVHGYDAKIPAVLQMMKEHLLAHNGTVVEGIFRLSPDKDACSVAKDAINSGTFSGCADVHIIANLIKVRLR